MFLLNLVILIVVLQFLASCGQLVNIVEDLAAKERVAGRDQNRA